MPQPQTAQEDRESDPPYGRELYLKSLARELAGALQDVLGADDAAGFISIAAQRVASSLAPQGSLTREEIAGILVQLKGGIGGDFYVARETPDSIVLGNRTCPFGQQVVGRTSLCMTTSNILGTVTAKHLGYARIELQKTIAEGLPECLIVVHLKPAAAATNRKGREYYATATTE